MKLGLAIGYSGAHLDLPVALLQRAEELGYDSVWSAEAYGSDAITPPAFLAGKTNRIKLGTGIMQLAARTPANAAMSAASIDAMAGGGRFIAGLGVSGPQIVEGWYGQPWGRPYYRVKDYVAIMRKIFKREGPVTHEGRGISLPYKGEGSAGLAKPLKSILHMNPDIPIYLATGGEAMVKLTAEIADGWLPFRAGRHGGVWPMAGGRLPPRRQRQELEGFHHPGLRPCRGRQRRERSADAPQAGGRALRGRHGSPDQEFSQRGYGSARLRRRRPAHPGTVPRGPQGRSHRHRARRMGRSEIAGRPTGAHPRTLPCLGGQRRGFAQRAIGLA
jgi:alkanesulfonate monooxygenase SsuD/methylene tetrahydromethanopterin reductase-like flavin-dependent oxidoreductase (luciferase family)